MPRKLARTLVLTVALATLGVLANAPSVLAYGSNTQWQVGFSGTCSPQALFCPFAPPGVSGLQTGFWGWCAFGGSATDGMSGTMADCQITTYLGPGTSFHGSFDSQWVIKTGSIFLPPGVPGFFLKNGTFELRGPGAPGPTGVPIPIPDPCVPIVICDTGIPAIPGHISFHPLAGVELNIQVTKLP